MSYKYFAFISYSHKDKKWGEKIHRALLRYRFPSIVRKSASRELPNKIQPIFLDSDNLKSGHVWENIKPALDQSRKLIVICSPHSAQPNAEGKQWVNEEVSYFVSQGRAEDIIPIMVSGDLQTSRCPALLEQSDILVHDVRRLGTIHTVSNIVAGLVGLDPDELWRREERRVKRNRNAWIAVSAVSLLMISFALYFSLDAILSHIEYYKGIALACDIPVGIEPVNRKDALKEPSCAKFVYRGYDKLIPPRHRLLRSVEIVDSNDHRISDTSLNGIISDKSKLGIAPTSWFLKYDGDGVLLVCESFDVNGKLLERVKYLDESLSRAEILDASRIGNDEVENCPIRVAYGENGNRASARAFALDGSYVEYKYNNQGFVLSESCCTSDGSPGSFNSSNISKITYGRDECGRETFRRYWGEDGCRVLTDEGVSGYKTSYDESGNESEITYVDVYDNVTTNAMGFSIGCRNYDSDGREIGCYFLDAKRRRVNTAWGIGGREFSYDSKGRQQSSTSVDCADNPVVDADGICTTLFEHDSCNRKVGEAYLGTDGKPCIHRQLKVAGWKSEYNAMGLEVLLEYYGTDKRLKDCMNGYAKRVYEYDAKGRILKQAHFQADGSLHKFQLFHGTESIFVDTITHEYDRSNRDIILAHVSRDNDKSGQCAYVLIRVAANSDIESWCFLDANKKLVDGPMGYSSLVMQYSDRHEISACETKDKHNAPVAIKETGVSKWTRKVAWVDNGDKVVELRFFGANGFPVIHKLNGNAYAKIVYDKQGRLKSFQPLGALGEPVVFPDTEFVGLNVNYDDCGNVVEVQIPGKDGKEGLLGNFSSFSIEYDYNQEQIKLIGFDRNKSLVSERKFSAQEAASFLENINTLIQRVTNYEATICGASQTQVMMGWKNEQSE